MEQGVVGCGEICRLLLHWLIRKAGRGGGGGEGEGEGEEERVRKLD